MESDSFESHKFLPSGHWEGFYCYNKSPNQHKMKVNLYFSKNKVSGSGIDDINSFKWAGKYNLKDYQITMTKIYPTHSILYNGNIDENGIWGIWNNDEAISKISLNREIISAFKKAFEDQITGGFHIWPKRKNDFREEYIEGEELIKSSKLEEIYIEHFTSKSQV